MDKIIDSLYWEEDPSAFPNLPDNTRLLAENGIFSMESPDAARLGREFSERLENGEILYLLGFQGIIHNSGVSLVEVSREKGICVLANLEEERFQGKKHFAGYPERAVAETRRLLTRLGRSPRDIFCVLHGWDTVQLEMNFQRLRMEMQQAQVKSNTLDDHMMLTVISQEARQEVFNPRRKNFYVYSPLLIRIYQRLTEDLGLYTPIPCIQMPHHGNHAWFSYGISPFCRDEEREKTTMIACIDGNGDRGATSLYAARAGEIRLLGRMGFLDSLGNFYGLLASFLGGWSALSAEGRYMGAAAWGDGSRLTNPYYKRLRRFFSFSSRGRVHANRIMAEDEYARVQEITGPFVPKEKLWNPDAVLNVDDIQHSPITKERVDVAAAVQMVFEDALFHIIDFMIRETASDRLVLCGGTALNCVANMRLLEAFDGSYYWRTLGQETRLHLWVPPVPSDQGVVAGAPFRFAFMNGAGPPAESFSPFVCGLSPASDRIRQALEETGHVQYEVLGNISQGPNLRLLADFMAFSVSRNAVIGIFQGPAETGPRALGHRSILSNPCNPDSLAILNTRIKRRERIRPLAPMVTLEAAREWFHLSPGASPGRYDAYDYMVLTVPAREKAKEKIPAVIHYDGTSRIQVVREQNNALMHAYLTALQRHIGVAVSINTSLNVGSPIVQTPSQALEIFQRARGLDAIFMVGETGEVFMVWARQGTQEFPSRILEIKAAYREQTEGLLPGMAN